MSGEKPPTSGPGAAPPDEGARADEPRAAAGAPEGDEREADGPPGAEGEGEGEPGAEGEPSAEGEGEPSAEGEGEPSAEGEGPPGAKVKGRKAKGERRSGRKGAKGRKGEKGPGGEGAAADGAGQAEGTAADGAGRAKAPAADGVGRAEAPAAGVVIGGRRFRWKDIETSASGFGMLSFFGFVWAFSTQLNQWSAAPFVLLFYGMALGALVATYAAWRAGPKGTPSTLRGVLWTLVTILVLWFWVPFARPAYYWLYRHVSLYFLS